MAVTETTDTRMPEWTFGDRLRKARREAKLTQEQMASALGLEKVGRYSAWEADNANPRDIITVAKRVAEVTGVPVDWLLGLSASGYRLTDLEVLATEGDLQQSLPFPPALSVIG